MKTDDLKRVRDWAAQRIESQSETPWDWIQLMKLSEALDHLIPGEAPEMVRTAELPEQAPHSDMPPLMADDQPNTVQFR